MEDYCHKLIVFKKPFILFQTIFLLGMVCLLFFPFSAKAQRKTKFEKLLDWGYRIVEGDSAKPRKSYLVALPIWGRTPETGWQIGLSTGYLFKFKQDTLTRPSLLRLNWQFTQKGQFSIRPFVDVFFAQNRYHLKSQFVFNNFNEYYWGIGNSAPNSAKEFVRFKQQKAFLSLRRRFGKALYAGFQANYEKMYGIRFEDQSPTPTSAVAGINGFSTLGIGPSLVFDNRDQLFFTQKGCYIETLYLINFPFANHTYSNRQFYLDARYFKTLWKENVLAFQMVMNNSQGITPFRQLPVIGNDAYMRGFYNGRYRDMHLLVLQAEFRKTIWGPFGAVAFLGAGNVASTMNRIHHNIKPNYGFGIRGKVLRKQHLNARVDLGFGGKGNTGLYLTLSEAF